MFRLTSRDFILLILAAGLGVMGGLWGLYILVLISLVALFVSLSVSPKFRHHELVFMFPLSIISCLPEIILLAGKLMRAFDFLISLPVQRVFYFTFFLLVLISIEELILGVVGSAIWGDQKMFFYDDSDPQETVETHYLTDITGTGKSFTPWTW